MAVVDPDESYGGGGEVSTVLIALLFMAGVLVVCAGCIGIAVLVDRSGRFDRIWK